MTDDLNTILSSFKEGDLDHYEAMKKIQKRFSGLQLDCEEIELKCINCGKEIIPFATDMEIIVLFDPGYPDTRVTPGEPPNVHVICQKCKQDWDKL